MDPEFPEFLWTLEKFAVLRVWEEKTIDGTFLVRYVYTGRTLLLYPGCSMREFAFLDYEEKEEFYG